MGLNPSMKYQNHQMQLLFNLHLRKQMYLIAHLFKIAINSTSWKKNKWLVSILKTTLSSIPSVSWAKFESGESGWIFSLPGIWHETRNMLLFIAQSQILLAIPFNTEDLQHPCLFIYDTVVMFSDFISRVVLDCDE